MLEFFKNLYNIYFGNSETTVELSSTEAILKIKYGVQYHLSDEFNYESVGWVRSPSKRCTSWTITNKKDYNLPVLGNNKFKFISSSTVPITIGTTLTDMSWLLTNMNEYTAGVDYNFGKHINELIKMNWSLVLIPQSHISDEEYIITKLTHKFDSCDKNLLVVVNNGTVYTAADNIRKINFDTSLIPLDSIVDIEDEHDDILKSIVCIKIPLTSNRRISPTNPLYNCRNSNKPIECTRVYYFSTANNISTQKAATLHAFFKRRDRDLIILDESPL